MHSPLRWKEERDQAYVAMQLSPDAGHALDQLRAEYDDAADSLLAGLGANRFVGKSRRPVTSQCSFACAGLELIDACVHLLERMPADRCYHLFTRCRALQSCDRDGWDDICVPNVAAAKGCERATDSTKLSQPLHAAGRTGHNATFDIALRCKVRTRWPGNAMLAPLPKLAVP